MTLDLAAIEERAKAILDCRIRVLAPDEQLSGNVGGLARDVLALVEEVRRTRDRHEQLLGWLASAALRAELHGDVVHVPAEAWQQIRTAALSREPAGEAK